MLHPATELKFLGSKTGYGVFATEYIPRGTVTWTLDSLDRIFLDAEIKALSLTYGPNINNYIFRVGRKNVFSWDNAKYINHSCKASCLGTSYGFEVAVFDIAPGMQLTRDYADTMRQDEESFACGCNEPICRKVVSGADANKFRDYWKKALKEALNDFYSVSQPLEQLLDTCCFKQAFRDTQ
ncbi:MAG: SET domain-containing protein [Methanothrix sp.]|jgi:hypothetical protein|nr:SET domain-containing protein [Methanothrix sp.]